MSQPFTHHCSNCGGTGHRTRQCQDPPRCWVCHGLDHRKLACPKRSSASGSPPLQQADCPRPQHQQAACLSLQQAASSPSDSDLKWEGPMAPVQVRRLVRSLQQVFPQAGFRCEVLGDQAFIHAAIQVAQEPLRQPSDTAFGEQAAQPGRSRRRKRGGKRGGKKL